MIEAARRKKGWSLEKLAEASKLSVGALRKAINGGPSLLSTLELIALALGLEVESLFLLDDPPIVLENPLSSHDGKPSRVEILQEANSQEIKIELYLKIIIGENVSKDSKAFLALQELLKGILPNQEGFRLVTIGVGVAVFGVAKTRANEIALAGRRLEDFMKNNSVQNYYVYTYHDELDTGCGPVALEESRNQDFRRQAKIIYCINFGMPFEFYRFCLRTYLESDKNNFEFDKYHSMIFVKLISRKPKHWDEFDEILNNYVSMLYINGEIEKDCLHALQLGDYHVFMVNEMATKVGGESIYRGFARVLSRWEGTTRARFRLDFVARCRPKDFAKAEKAIYDKYFPNGYQFG